MGKIREWVGSKPVLSLVVAFVVGVVIGSAGGSAETTPTAAEEPDETAALEAEIESLELELAEAETRAEEAEEAAEEKLDALAARDAQLDAREKKVNKVERVAEKSTITDGVWAVGKEITPGVYRSPAGSDCYWAILSSANTQDIDSNGGFNANQTVTLTAGKWFETSGCGTWKKIG